MHLRKHITYANVAATLALAGVVGGGGAYAVGLIDSGDVRNNSLRSQDLKNRKAVKARDVRREALTGNEIKERTLEGGEFAPMAGDRGSCVPADGVFAECASTQLRLRTRSRLLVVATGDFFGSEPGARLVCRIAIDGEPEAGGSTPGQIEEETGIGATDGFARTRVTGPASTGVHSVALQCAQVGSLGAELATASIAVLGIGEGR